MVFHDFPALARVARGATSIPTDPRVTVIVDDNSGNVIYSALSWAHGIMTPIPTRTAVPYPDAVAVRYYRGYADSHRRRTASSPAVDNSGTAARITPECCEPTRWS